MTAVIDIVTEAANEVAAEVALDPEKIAERERRDKAIALVQSWIDEGDEDEQNIS
jgi:hypothetical protein